MQRFQRRSPKCGRRRQTNSARISHPPPFRRVTEKHSLITKVDLQPIISPVKIIYTMLIDPNGCIFPIDDGSIGSWSVATMAPMFGRNKKMLGKIINLPNFL